MTRQRHMSPAIAMDPNHGTAMRSMRDETIRVLEPWAGGSGFGWIGGFPHRLALPGAARHR